MGLMQWFTPKDTVFFDLFEQQAAIVTEAAHQLVSLTKDFSGVRRNAMQSNCSNMTVTG